MISKWYQIGIQTFFGLTAQITESLEPIGISVPNEFKLLSVSGTFSLEVKNMLGLPNSPSVRI